MDIRFWLLDMKDHFNVHGLDDSLKAQFALMYMSKSIKQRTQLIWINDPMEAVLFNDWNWLRLWLEENFGLTEPGLDAEEKMKRLHMWGTQSVQDFTNTFETLLQDIPWAGSDAAVKVAYHKKLSPAILKQIHATYFNELSVMYTEYKKAAQKGESHLALQK